MLISKLEIMDDNLLTQRLDRITTEFLQSFGELSPEQLNWTPSTKLWSIAQNIEHLILVNESYYPVIWTAFRNDYPLPFYARFDFVVRYMGNSILTSVQPHSKRKVKTYKPWQPTDMVEAEILERFNEQQDAFKQLLKTSKILCEKGCLIPSPVNAKIVYPLDIAFEILVAHEERHLNQAKEVLLELGRR